MAFDEGGARHPVEDDRMQALPWELPLVIGGTMLTLTRLAAGATTIDWVRPAMAGVLTAACAYYAVFGLTGRLVVVSKKERTAARRQQEAVVGTALLLGGGGIGHLLGLADLEAVLLVIGAAACLATVLAWIRLRATT